MIRVHFTKPVVESIVGKEPEGRPTFLSYPEIQSVTRHLKEQGYDERSIVAKRHIFPNGTPNLWLMAGPRNWGIVVDLRSTAIAVSGDPYKPIRVQWVRDGSISDHWPEELVMIHSAISQFGAETVVKEQLDDSVS